MFEMLNNINWSKLKQAHGNAGHIPDALRGLTSPEKKIREKSYWKIDNYVVLQSDLYEAAYYVIPFLIEILESGMKNGRSLVYDLLFEIGNGNASETSKCKYKGEFIPLEKACRRSVAEKIPLYLKDAEESDISIVKKALELLSSFTEYKSEILPKLYLLLEKAPDGRQRELLEEAISELNDLSEN